jgi:multiple sugar transport system permease protein
MKTKQYIGYLYVAPWILGFLLFTLSPLIFAFYVGLTEWDTFNPPKFVGLDNYTGLLKDEDFWQSLKVTVRFAIFHIPLGICASFIIAMLVNTKLRGVKFFRTALYLPAIVTGVSISLLWKWVLDTDFGLLNLILSKVGLGPIGWLTEPNWVLPSYLVMGLWGAGGAMLTYLAGLQDIPDYLYEAAEIDGANMFQKFKVVTFPMMSPIIFYNLIIGITAAFREFQGAFIIGGTDNQALFYMLYLYQNAFDNFKMGKATAMAWILFVIILTVSWIALKTSKYWVHYGDAEEVTKKKKKKLS